MQRVLSIFLSVVLLLPGIAVIWYTWPRDGHRQWHAGTLITIPRPDTVMLLEKATLVTWYTALTIVVFLVVLRCLLHRRVGSVIPEIIAIVGLPFIVGFSIARYHIASWPILATLRTANGVTYHSLSSGIAGGSLAALAEEQHRGLFIQGRLLGTVDAQGGPSWIPVILPERLAHTLRKHRFVLLCTPDKRMVVDIYRNSLNQPDTGHITAMDMTYDTHNNTFYGGRPAFDLLPAQIDTISPFILLDDDDVPDQRDVQQLCDIVGDTQPEWPCLLPKVSTIIQATQSDNPHIRIAAVRILACYHEEKATTIKVLKHLALDDPDPVVRRSVASALVALTSLSRKEANPSMSQ